MTKFILSIGSILVLNACSTFTRQECEQMDWRKQGSNTAMKGDTLAQGEGYFQRECEDVPVDVATFRAGYQDALPTFCTPENIRMFSERGGEYQGTCPEAAADSKFTLQYQWGREKYLVNRISELESKLSSVESDLSSAQSEIDSLRGQTCQ